MPHAHRPVAHSAATYFHFALVLGADTECGNISAYLQGMVEIHGHLWNYWSHLWHGKGDYRGEWKGKRLKYLLMLSSFFKEVMQ